MTLLKICDLSAGYKETIIIREINLELKHGEILCLLGRNGVGKSTLLKAIMGLNNTMEGEIHFSDEPVKKLRPFQKANLGIAYAPQEKAIFPSLTVEQNLLIGVKNGTKKAELYKEVFNFFPIMKVRLKQKAGNLSGGEKKMLLMSKVLIHKSKLVLLDEIIEGVQPSIITTFIDVIKSLNKEYGTTFLIAEQNIDFVVKVSNTYALMDQGLIVRQGTVDGETKELLQRHLVL